MRGVHRGVITLELVISLGLMATLCAAIMPSITAMVQSVRILSRRVEDRSTSLFIADFLTEKIRNTVEGVEKEARQGNTYDYREEMQDGTWQTYTLRQQGSRLEIRIPGGFSQPITGGAGDVETVTDVEGNTTVADRQTLTKENQWSYTWKNLSTLMCWSVSEAEVPNGYTVAVTREGNTVVLTNTAKKPGKSDGEVNPPSKKPTDKTTNKTTDKTSDKTSDKLPQTGQLWWPVLVLLFAGAICLLVGRVLRDRKEEKNR